MTPSTLPLRPFVAAVPLLLALLSLGCNRDGGAPAAGGPPAGKKLPRVLVIPVEKRTLAWTIEAMGELEPKEQVQVAASVPGIVRDVAFNEGDMVTPETVLCTVDEERYRLEEERASADVKATEADQKLAQATYSQRQPLHAEKIISDQELAEVQAALDRANAQVERSKAALRIAEKAKRDCKVRPPIAGRIQAKMVSTGEYVAAGGSIATIVDVSELRVRFTVPETEAVQMKTGLEATFRSRGSAPGEKAVVYWVSQVAEPRTRSVTCKARLVNAPETLKPGTSGTITMNLEARGESIVVPTEAVFPTERGFITFVMDGKNARERKLKLGVRTADDKLEVIEGLKGDETLVLRGGSSLKDGQEVEVAR